MPSGYYPSQQVQQPLVHQFQVHQSIDVRQILPPPHQQQPSFPVHTLAQPSGASSIVAATPQSQEQQSQAVITKIKWKDHSQGQSVPQHLRNPDQFYSPNCPRIHGGAWDLKVEQENRCGKIDQKPWKCVECGKQYANEVSAKEHVSIEHLNIKPYECHVCHKTFSRGPKFSNHKSTHK